MDLRAAVEVLLLVVELGEHLALGQVDARQLLVLLALQVQALERAGRLEVVRVVLEHLAVVPDGRMYVAEHVLADLRGLHVQERRHLRIGHLRDLLLVDLSQLGGVVGGERHALELRLRRLVRGVFAERARVGVAPR